MKTAFAYWDDRIAPAFDTARQVHVVETVSGQIVSETQETLSEDQPIQKMLRLVELGICTLVCGAISTPMNGLVAAYGIHVVPFVAGDLGEVVRAWLNGNLERDVLAMPGCWDSGRRRRMFGMNKGEYEMNGKGRGKSQGQGRKGNTGADGGVGTCLCPKCGQTEPHERGVPCVERTCPRCGTVMIRQ